MEARVEAPEKELEQTREDARWEILLQQADEGKPQ